MSQQLRTATLVVAAAALFGLARNAVAQDAKIAVVDIQTLTLMSDEGKVIGEKLEKRYQEISAEMQKLQQAIEEKENRLRTQDRLMSAAAKTQLNREINDDKVAFDRRNEDYQRELSELQNRLLDPVAAKAQAELATFVNEKGYTLLLDLSAQNGNVVWANPANDVTAEVLKRMNQTFKQGGTPAPAADSPNAAIPPVPSPQ